MKKSGTVIVLAVFMTLALVWTHPLVPHMKEAIPYTILPSPGLERVDSFAGDHLQFYYRLWLFDDSLRKGHPFSPTGYEFNDYMGRRVVSAQFVPLSLAFAAFSALGATWAYNLLLLLTFPLTGLFTYLLIRSYGGGFWAGMAGSAVGTFLPYRIGQLMGGHPNGFVFFVLPLFLWLLEGYLTTGRRWQAWAAGLVLFSQSLMELHAAYYTFLFLAFYLPLRWLIPVQGWLEAHGGERSVTSPSRGPAWILFLPPVSLFFFRLINLRVTDPGPANLFPALVSAALWALAAVLLQALSAACVSGVSGLGIRESFRVVSPFFLPLAILLLYGIKLILPVPYLGRTLLATSFLLSLFFGIRSLYGTFRDIPVRLRLSGLVEGRVSGIVSLFLAAAASLSWIFYLKATLLAGSIGEEGRSLGEALLFTPHLSEAFRRTNPAVEFYVYPGLVSLTVVLAGILFGKKVITGRSLPAWPLWFFGATAAVTYLFCFGQRGEVLLPLHGIARELVPFMNYIRVPSRIMILFAPAMAVLVGLSLQRLTSPLKKGRTSAILGAAVTLAILVDFWPASVIGLTTLPERNAVYEEKSLGGGGRLVEVPIWPGDSAWSSLYQYWITRYGHRIINGYSPVVPAGYYREVFAPLEGLNVGYLGTDEAGLLKDLGVGSLVLHRFPPRVSLFPFALTLEGLKRSPYLEYRLREEPMWLFHLREKAREAAAPPPLTSPAGVVFQGESAALRPAGLIKWPGGRAAAGGGQNVPVISGPGRLFPPGRFRARMRIGPAGEGKKSPEAVFLRLKDRSGEVLGKAVFNPGQGSGDGMGFYDYFFETSRSRRLVFEVTTDGPEAAVDYLYILYRDQEDPLSSAEMEDLHHIGWVREDPVAAGGQAVALVAGVAPPISFPAGLRRYLPAGRWEVSVWYRLGKGQGDGGLVEIREYGGPSLGRVILGPGESGESDYHAATTTLQLDRGLFFDLEVTYSGQTDLLLDRIEVVGS